MQKEYFNNMKSGDTVYVIDTKTANLASVRACFQREGRELQLLSNPGEILEVPYLVLPGVGAFAAAMAELTRREFVEPLRARLRTRKKTLAICLGLQLLFESSEESPGVIGLGIFPGAVRRIANAPRLPHFGWNELVPFGTPRLLAPGFAYFANSFAATGPLPAEVAGTSTEYGSHFVSALECGGLLACQFHPELSGRYGAELIRRWLAVGDLADA